MRLAIMAGLLLGAAPAFAAEVTVTESNQKFDHDHVQLNAGDALVVTNADSGDHDLSMTGEEGDPQNLGVQKPGRVLRVNFPAPGTYKLRCTITPDMRLSVEVN